MSDGDGRREVWRRVVAVAVTGALLAIGAGQPAIGEPAQTASSKSKAIRRATARLANKRFTRFVRSGMGSFDQRLHLCRKNRHFIYDTVSSTEGGGDPDVRRAEGRWRVVSAHIKGKVWSARVKGRPSDGSPAISVRIRTTGKRTTIDGNTVIVERSDLC
jgi:hypothetical protein